jgi:hypothetical protein
MSTTSEAIIGRAGSCRSVAACGWLRPTGARSGGRAGGRFSLPFLIVVSAALSLGFIGLKGAILNRISGSKAPSSERGCPMIAAWFYRPAAWWQIWRPQSGPMGGAIAAAIVCVALALALVLE